MFLTYFWGPGQISCRNIVLLQLVSQGVFELGVKLPSSHKNLRTCCRTTQGTCHLQQLQIQQFWLPSHFLNKYVPKHFCIPAWGINGSQEAQHIGDQLFRDLLVSAMWTHLLVEQFSLALPAVWWRATLIVWNCNLLHLLQPAKLTKHVVTHYCFHLTTSFLLPLLESGWCGTHPHLHRVIGIDPTRKVLQ